MAKKIRNNDHRRSNLRKQLIQFCLWKTLCESGTDQYQRGLITGCVNCCHYFIFTRHRNP